MVWNRVLPMLFAPAVLVLGGVAGQVTDGQAPFTLLGAAGSVGIVYATRSPRARRHRLLQAWTFLVLLMSFVVGYTALYLLLAGALLDPLPGGMTTDRLSEARGLSILSVLIWSGVMIGTQASKVGYRWGDFPMILIPVYGTFILLPKLLWRIAGLPHRPWDKNAVADPPNDTSLETVRGVALIRSSNTALPPPPLHAEPSNMSVSLPSHEGGGGSPLRQRAWFIPAITLGTALLSVTATFVLVSRASPNDRSDVAARAADHPQPSAVQADPDPQPSPPPELKVIGTLFVRSPSAIVKYGPSDYVVRVCRRPDRDEVERLEATTTRLALTSDKDGDLVLGAAGTHGAGRLVGWTVGGEFMCGWEVKFLAYLPADTLAFFVHYGYTDYYWGPFSDSEAGDIRIAMTR